jgi:glycosyltransferase involved in cell wall biosynthesis
MRVAYPMRVDALDKSGGDVEHIGTYIRMCEQIARERGFLFQGEILTDLHPDLSGFDAIHLTNLDRPVDLYSQFLAAKKAGKPIVLTPLHHSYREIERFERKGRGGLVGIVSGLVGFYGLEGFRILLKSRRYPQLRAALWKALRKGFRRAQAEVLLGCDRVLVITDKEAADIAQEVGELPPERILKLRNGFQSFAAEAGERDIDIAVISRIESRKNQIAILDAIQSLGLKATFVGPPNPNHKQYCELFRRKIAGSASTYIPGVPSSEVISILARAKVHVAASWFEVASLVDLDAYANGCRVVATRCGGTHEVIGEDAYYVDPASPADIAEKIAAAVESVRTGRKNSMREFLERTPTWSETCTQLLDIYSSLTGVES